MKREHDPVAAGGMGGVIAGTLGGLLGAFLVDWNGVAMPALIVMLGLFVGTAVGMGAGLVVEWRGSRRIPPPHP